MLHHGHLSGYLDTDAVLLSPPLLIATYLMELPYANFMTGNTFRELSPIHFKLLCDRLRRLVYGRRVHAGSGATTFVTSYLDAAPRR